MGITFGDHLIGYYDITPEQEREREAREECARRGIDPDGISNDGFINWRVVFSCSHCSAADRAKHWPSASSVLDAATFLCRHPIITADGAHLTIRLDGMKHTMPYHPTWELRYLEPGVALTQAQGKTP